MKIHLFYILAFGLLLSSCGDQWLEEKRDISLTVPASLDDVRALLNNSLLRNDLIGLAEASADEYQVTDQIFNARQPRERAAYLWEKDLLAGVTTTPEWDESYKQVFQCNVALDALARFNPEKSGQHVWNVLYGEALFFRAKTFFNLAQLFAAPYDPSRMANKLGIPLRLQADVNEITKRAGLEETYQQIVQDLTTASRKLDPEPIDLRQTSKPAAFALLARCYLSMRDYEKAGNYADSCLQISHRLMDFNLLSAIPIYPIAPFNEEVILSSTLAPLYGIFNKSNAIIPKAVYDLYEDDDLRKSLFFFQNPDQSMGFRGSYLGSTQFFPGITTSEMLLVRAECSARAGHTDAALADLNTLLEKRHVAGHFNALTSSDGGDVVNLVLTERRKELIRRGLRWQDLRRLNLEPGHQVSLSRTVSGVTYTLSPNDPRYVFPIPDYIIQATGIAQNER